MMRGAALPKWVQDKRAFVFLAGKQEMLQEIRFSVVEDASAYNSNSKPTGISCFCQQFPAHNAQTAIQAPLCNTLQQSSPGR